MEQALKVKLTCLFSTEGHVQRAYLVRVSHSSDQSMSVLLAVYTGSAPDVELIGRVAEIFASLFNSDQHLDIVFVTHEQEIKIRTCCSPFF